MEDEEEAIRHAASLMGRRTSERKKQTSAANLVKAREKRVVTEEMKAKMRASQKARRERERLQLEQDIAERNKDNG